jgi:NADPH-dependent glutamate synthase beta subunit-like oxidoreductase
MIERGRGGRDSVVVVRARRPIDVDSLPRCIAACPAGEDVQVWLVFAQAGRWKDAWERLVTDNPLPAAHGRVCHHPCDASCNHHEFDGAVSIHAVGSANGAAEAGVSR